MRSLLAVAGLALLLWTDGVPTWSQPQPPGPGREAHLVRRDAPGSELVFPCCQGVEPPAGFFFVWVQDAWRMTPYSMLIGASGSQPVGEGLLSSLQLADAGRVQLSEGVADADFELHLLHAGSYLEAGFPRWEVAPRRPAEEVGTGVLLPAGPALGALWSRSLHRYVALSRPFSVRGRTTVDVPLEQPSGTAHLMVQVQRQEAASTAADLDAELVLKRDAGERPPDLKVLTADRVYAVWYGLPPGPAEVRGRSQKTFLEPQTLELLPGRVEYLTGQLRPRPALDVDLDLPAPLRQERLSLEVRRVPSGEVVAQQALKPAADAHRFEELPPAMLEVVLKTGSGSFSRQVDLSSGRDGYLLLDPELVTLRGTVFHGEDEHAAKLAFTTTTGEISEARSDENGLYEVVLINPLRGVSIELDGIQGAPYTDFFAPAIAKSQDLDFHVPDVEIGVLVRDAVTGRGVRGSVMVRNTYRVEDEEFEPGRQRDRQEKERVISQAASTDETGLARFSFLRRGEVEIRATAKGYLPLREPVKGQVLGDEKQSFEVRLKPLGETVTLHLLFPDGSPASGAEALLTDSLGAGAVLLVTRADGKGSLDLPRQQAGFLLVKHPSAAFLVREWRPRDDESEVDWMLPPAAGLPLTVRVQDASGKGAAAQAELALWVEGHRLSGTALAWLTGASTGTDSNGYWIGKNLPRGPVEVLAWSLRVREEATAGTLDSLATGVPFPWPVPVEVRAVE